jgi:hypothetical protein
MEARMAFVYTELTFNFDLAIPAAVNALRLLGKGCSLPGVRLVTWTTWITLAVIN